MAASANRVPPAVHSSAATPPADQAVAAAQPRHGAVRGDQVEAWPPRGRGARVRTEAAQSRSVLTDPAGPLPGGRVASQDVSATTSSSRVDRHPGSSSAWSCSASSPFAIGLPRPRGRRDGERPPTCRPDTLPGGYAAADDAASFADGDLGATGRATAAGSQHEYGNQVLLTPGRPRSRAARRRRHHGGFRAGVPSPTVVRSPLARSPTPGPRSSAGGTTMERSEVGAILTRTEHRQGAPARPPQSRGVPGQPGRATAQIQSAASRPPSW